MSLLLLGEPHFERSYIIMLVLTFIFANREARSDLFILVSIYVIISKFGHFPCFWTTASFMHCKGSSPDSSVWRGGGGWGTVSPTPPSNARITNRCPTIQLNSNCIHLKTTSDPTSRLPSTSEADHKPRLLPVFLTDWL